MEKIIAIKIKDLCYYNDDFNYNTYYVLNDEKYNQNIGQFKKLCVEYESFTEIENFIKEHFTEVEVKTITIEI